MLREIGATGLGWVAGVVDGGGLITLDRDRADNGRGWRYLPAVGVGSAAVAMPAHLKQVTGAGWIAPGHAARRRPSWYWHLEARHLEEFLIAVSPHLVVKRPQADLLLEYLVTVPRSADGDGPTDEVVSLRAAIFDELAVLNRV